MLGLPALLYRAARLLSAFTHRGLHLALLVCLPRLPCWRASPLCCGCCGYAGTLNVIDACRREGVRKCVMSSSPSTRFDGKDMDGVKDSEIPIRPRGQFLEAYAETKAMGEVAMREACDGDSFLSVAVAPHQVYGPRDSLMLPNLTEAALSGKLRVFGPGTNKVSFCYVDNYCHGLIIAEEALYPGSPALGQFYIVTDGGYELFWEAMDRAFVALGGARAALMGKCHYPTWLMMGAAHAATCVGKLVGRKFKLKPFSVRMLTIHRWFDISRARQDLNYEPVVARDEAWRITLEWFRDNWLPNTRFADRARQ